MNRANTYGLGWTSSVTGGGWRFQVKSGATTYTVDATNAKVEAGRWYFVAGTYDGSTLKVYVDGSLVNSNTISSKTIDNTTSALTIGLVGSGYWDGAVDEVGLWADDLSSTQIADLQAAARRTSADVALTTRTDYDALGRAVSSTSPRGIQTRHEYDRLGRMTATIANARDGTPTSASSDDDMKSTFAYNAVGELIGHCSAKQVHLGGCDPTSSGEDQAWRYAYDAMGRRISQTPPVNTTATALAVREWSYQAGGRLSSVIDRTVAGGGTIHRHTDYSHDTLGRVTGETVYLGSGTSNPELTWTTSWNADGTRDGRDFDGTAASPAQGTDSWDFTYDSLGRPDLVKQGSTTVTDYAWNPTGTLASRADVGISGTTSFAYDWARRQSSVTAPTLFGSGSIGFGYGLDGNLATRSTPNGVTASASYDPAKRPTEIDFAGDTLSRAYDRDGNVTSEGRSFTAVSGDAGTGTATFTFDGLGRVTGMDGLARDDTFSYDRNGNRVTKVEGATTLTYLYDRGDQLIKQTIASTDTVFAYNAYGDMTSSADAFNTATAHAYDAGSRLVSLTPPGASASTYTHHALGRVTSRTTGSATLTYRYVGTGHVSYATVPGTGSATYSLIDAADGRVALDTGGTTAWTMFDLHGNLAGAQAESSATVVSALRYDAWGKLLDDYTAGSGATDMPWRFQGRLDMSPDADEALYDFGARMYRPSAGTFTQLDTFAGYAQNPLSMNRFLYAHANPVTLVDPDGHAVPMIDGLCVPGSCNVAPAVYQQSSGTAQQTQSRVPDFVNTFLDVAGAMAATIQGAGVSLKDVAGRLDRWFTGQAAALSSAAAAWLGSASSIRGLSLRLSGLPFRLPGTGLPADVAQTIGKGLAGGAALVGDIGERLGSTLRTSGATLVKWGSRIGIAGSILSGGSAAVDQWEADADRTDLRSAGGIEVERLARAGMNALVQGGLPVALGAAGALCGPFAVVCMPAGAVAGTFIADFTAPVATELVSGAFDVGEGAIDLAGDVGTNIGDWWNDLSLLGP